MEKKRTAASKRWWVVLHHDEISVVEQAEKPSTTVEKGERQKRVRGPYATKEQAQVVADERSSRTLRVQNGR